MRMEAIHRAEDHDQKCPSCRGAIHRRPFGEMYAGSFVLDGERVEIRREPDAEYRDPVYLDEITQYFDGGLYRMWPSETYLSRGGRRIHRDAWRLAFGPIPDGCHIHHRDGNVLNNSIENLECVPASIHLAESNAKRAKPEEGWFSQTARDKAADWHKSPEGRLWHKRHAERSKSWTKWTREEKPCEHCSKPFLALVRKSGNAGKYCSSICKSANYRERGITAAYSAKGKARRKAE